MPFHFQQPPASEDKQQRGSLATMGDGGFMDTQKAAFLKEVYEKEDQISGSAKNDDLAAMLEKDGLTPYQISLLAKVRSVCTDPINVQPRTSLRTPEQIAASQALHKRVNPGYVDIPYVSSNTLDYKYKPPPDFTREYLKADSDCKFQKYAAEAILKHVDLNKTSH